MKEYGMGYPVLSCIFLGSAIVAASAAHAQATNPTSRLETVTVTAAKPDLGDVIRTYVKHFAAPSPYLGKIARWESGVCPKVIGLRPDVAKLVVDRIETVAEMVGAPVAAKESCRPNVEIIVTPQPQALLDAVREKRSGVLGYSSGPSQTARMAIMNTARMNNATAAVFAPAGNARGYATGSIQCLINVDASTTNDDPACVPLNRLGVGVGGYKGQGALSVGFSRSLSSNASLTFGAAISGGESSGGVGVGVGW